MLCLDCNLPKFDNTQHLCLVKYCKICFKVKDSDFNEYCYLCDPIKTCIYCKNKSKYALNGYKICIKHFKLFNFSKKELYDSRENIRKRIIAYNEELLKYSDKFITDKRGKRRKVLEYDYPKQDCDSLYNYNLFGENAFNFTNYSIYDKTREYENLLDHYHYKIMKRRRLTLVNSSNCKNKKYKNFK